MAVNEGDAVADEDGLEEYVGCEEGGDGGAGGEGEEGQVVYLNRAEVDDAIAAVCSGGQDCDFVFLSEEREKGVRAVRAKLHKALWRVLYLA